MQKSLEKKVLHLQSHHPGNIHTGKFLFSPQKGHQTMCTFGTGLKKKKKKSSVSRTRLSRVVLWIGICLPIAGVRGLIPGLILWPQATKAGEPQLLSLEPVFCNKRSHCNEKPGHLQQKVGPAHHN